MRAIRDSQPLTRDTGPYWRRQAPAAGEINLDGECRQPEAMLRNARLSDLVYGAEVCLAVGVEEELSWSVKRGLISGRKSFMCTS